MPQGTDQSHAVGGSKGKPLLETSLPNQPSYSQPVPVGAQESLPKGVEDSVPNKVHDTGILHSIFFADATSLNSEAGSTGSKSHATGPSKVPQVIQVSRYD